MLSDATVPQSRELQRIIAMLVVAGNTQVLGILLTDRVLERTCCGCVIFRRVNQVTSPHLGFVQTAVERASFFVGPGTLCVTTSTAPAFSAIVPVCCLRRLCSGAAVLVGDHGCNAHAGVQYDRVESVHKSGTVAAGVAGG